MSAWTAYRKRRARKKLSEEKYYGRPIKIDVNPDRGGGHASRGVGQRPDRRSLTDGPYMGPRGFMRGRGGFLGGPRGGCEFCLNSPKITLLEIYRESYRMYSCFFFCIFFYAIQI